MQWADVFDRDVKDIFDVEDDIASAIVTSVRPMTAQKRDAE
jgi:TolB-like protein